MKLINLKVGEYFKLANGKIYRVECNDWWVEGKLRDFICVDVLGHKKHYSHLDSSTTVKGASIVQDFEIEKITCNNCGYAI